MPILLLSPPALVLPASEKLPPTPVHAWDLAEFPRMIVVEQSLRACTAHHNWLDAQVESNPSHSWFEWQRRADRHRLAWEHLRDAHHYADPCCGLESLRDLIGDRAYLERSMPTPLPLECFWEIEP